MSRLVRRSAVLLVVVAGFGRTAVAQDQRAAVVKAGQAMFDAMAKRDTAALRQLLHPAAQFVSTVQSGDSTVARVTTKDQFLAHFATTGERLLERMWNPEVRISGPIATIWTDYDFHRGATFSHCGIDAFQLVETKAGWQVTSIIYTVVPDPKRCKPSPLGSPK